MNVCNDVGAAARLEELIILDRADVARVQLAILLKAALCILEIRGRVQSVHCYDPVRNGTPLQRHVIPGNGRQISMMNKVAYFSDTKKTAIKQRATTTLALHHSEYNAMSSSKSTFQQVNSLHP